MKREKQVLPESGAGEGCKNNKIKGEKKKNGVKSTYVDICNDL
jgi:hypothetical protein